METVLFFCVHISGRPQMAVAFFNHLAKGEAKATSAGTSPTSRINPTVAEVMQETGIDIRRQRPRPLTPQLLKNADRVITMGCGAEEVCPASFIPTEDWGLEDPAGKPIEKVRQIRDKISARVRALI